MCNSMLVTWKLRRIKGRKWCQGCVDDWFERLQNVAYRPIDKKEVISRYKLVEVPVRVWNKG